MGAIRVIKIWGAKEVKRNSAESISETLGQIHIELVADTSQLDEAIEKAKELENILSRLTVDIEVER